MSDSLIKRAAMERLASNIGAFLAIQPDGASLVGKVLAEEAEQGDDATYPSLRILPGRFSFERHQESVEEQVTPYLQLVKVGELVGKLTLRLSETTVQRREVLEQVVRSAFFQEVEVQGRILDVLGPLTLAGTATTAPMPVVFDLEGDEWDDEKVFAEALYSDLTVEATFPLLIVRPGNVVQDLVLVVAAAVEADLTKDFDDATQVDELEVLADGTVTDF